MRVVGERVERRESFSAEVQISSFPIGRKPPSGGLRPPTGPLARFLAPYGGNEFLPQRQFTRGASGRGGQSGGKNHNSGVKKVVSRSVGHLLGSIMVSWWHPGNVEFFRSGSFFDAHRMGGWGVT